MKESTSMIHETQAKLKVTRSGGNDTPLWTFSLFLCLSRQVAKDEQRNGGAGQIAGDHTSYQQWESLGIQRKEGTSGLT